MNQSVGIRRKMSYPFDPNGHPLYSSVLNDNLSFLLGNVYQFELPKNTTLLATDSGTVVRTKFSSKKLREKRLPSMEDWHDVHSNNYVVIEHQDGTFSKYVHVKPSVFAGKTVESGEKIGGLYGFLGTPHLHFVAYDKNVVNFSHLDLDFI